MVKILSGPDFRARLATLVEVRHSVLSRGGVTLMDAMGGEAGIIEAARTTSNVEGRDLSDDENLFRYLMRLEHGSPLEFAEFVFLIEIPMDAWRQWIRHRVASINEFSSRYSDVPDVNDVTDPGQWRLQSKSNRQGSSGDNVADWPAGYEVEDVDGGEYWRVLRPYPDEGHMDVDERGRCLGSGPDAPTPGDYLSARERDLHILQREIYEERLKFGVAKEQARKDLCLSTYTRAYWKCNLRSLWNFLRLRTDSHAQKEIREYANVIGNIIAELCPAFWAAFLDYDRNAMKLTALDIYVVKELVARGMVNDPETYNPEDSVHAYHSSLWPEQWRDKKNCRERDECVAKLKKLGMLL